MKNLHSKYLQIQLELSNQISNGRFEKLIETMDEIIECGDNTSMITANQALAKPENLYLLLSRIINDPVMLSKTVAASYYHENGFHKIVLLAGKKFKLRLHHFGVAAKIPMENIHDHRWNFASTIIKGELKMDLFTIAPKGDNTEKTYHFIYESEKSKGTYTTDFVSVAHLRKSETRSYRPGETYLMETRELHRIKNSTGQESITLILTGKPISSKCNLFSKRTILEDEKVTKTYSEVKMIEMLERICETINPSKINTYVYSY